MLHCTSCRRTLGRAILSPTSPASTIWPGTRGGQTYNPWRGCHRFATTTLSMAACETKRLCGFAAKDRCAPPARRVQASEYARRSLLLRRKFGTKTCTVSIVDTVSRNSRCSRILETIRQIEADEGYRTKTKWEELYLGEEEAAFFLAKVDVSELELGVLQEGLPAMQRQLEAMGFGLYQINCTQDFAGTLDREALVEHLVNEHGFVHQGEEAIPGERRRILDNTGSVGAHVCTFVQTRNSHRTKTKFYNKDISQIEAGDIQKPFGEHLAHLVDSTNEHLRRTLAHPAVRSRGCTRIEISLYGCRAEDLSTNMAEALLAEALLLATTCGDECCALAEHPPCGTACCTAPGHGLFVVQSVARKWENHANLLDRCPVLGDRQRRDIYLARSGHSGTGRVQGMLVHTKRRSSGERREMGEGHAVDDGRLWTTKLPHFPSGDIGDGGGRGPLLPAASLHKKRPNHPSSIQQAHRAAPRGARPSRSSPAYKACGACLENKETTTDWCSNTLVRLRGGARDCCRQKTLHPL